MQIDPKPLPSIVGGKAYQLYRLKRVCNVPPFFSLSFDAPGEIEQPNIQERVLEHCQEHGFELMAVRSSATSEDSADASFAGMFRTVLNVQPANLISAIREVMASVEDRRVADYCQARNIPIRDVRMNVIVQKMVASRVAGVCFTRIEGNGCSLLMEACLGLGEALVSGKITPDSYWVNRNDLTVERTRIGYQVFMLGDSTRNGLESRYKEVPFHKRNARKLSDGEIRQVAATCLTIEQELGFESADVEWAFEADTLLILQARPYTGFQIQ